MMDRLDRQRRVPGWQQERLTQATVVVVGTDLLGQFIAFGLACLGIGRIFSVDNACNLKDLGLLRLHVRRGQSRGQALVELLKKIAPEIAVHGQPMRILYEECFRLLPTPTLVIEATSDPVSKYACLRYSQRWCVPAIFAGANSTGGRLSVHIWGRENPLSDAEYCWPDLADQKQNAATAMVIAGLALEEAQKILMPLDEHDEPIQTTLSYNRRSANRFDTPTDCTGTAEPYGGDCTVVGAGAIGNWVGIALVLSGVRRLSIIDYDHIEIVNLNRQVLFYEGVGRAKAVELARQLQRLNHVECAAIVGRVSEAYLEESKPALLISAVDNFTARVLLSRFAVRHSIPLINGGTSPLGGQMTVYQPGVSACLNCQSDIERRADLEKQVGHIGDSCAQAPEPSVVISNMIVAGLMAAEAGTVLKPASYGPPIKGMIEYSALLPIRVGLHSIREPCQCHGTVGRKGLCNEPVGAN